eukprot:COSAG06_NODE_1116_length_10641_cov_138.587270_12_plen_136_part_01
MLALVLVARGAVAAPLLVNSPQHRLPFPRWELLPARRETLSESVSRRGQSDTWSERTHKVSGFAKCEMRNVRFREMRNAKCDKPAVAKGLRNAKCDKPAVAKGLEARSVCSAVGLSRAHSRHASGRSGRPSVRKAV